MYGFIEKWLAEFFHIDFMTFGLNSGGEAAIVNRQDFDRIFHVLTTISIAEDRISPTLFHSDVAGMNILLHEFWSDDDVLDGLTGGDVKEHSIYLAIQEKGRGASRFNIDELKETLRERFVDDVEEEPDDAPVDEVDGEAGAAMTIDEVDLGEEGEDDIPVEPQHDPGELDINNGANGAPAVEADAPGQQINIAAGGQGHGIYVAGGGTTGTYTFTNQTQTGAPTLTDAVQVNDLNHHDEPNREAFEAMAEERENGIAEERVDDLEENATLTEEQKDVLEDIVDQVAPEAKEERKAEKPEPSPAAKFFNRIMAGGEVNILVNHEVEGTDLHVAICDFGSFPNIEPLLDLAREINRNVFVLTEQGSALLRTMRRRMRDFGEIYSHSIFLCVYPKTNANARMPDTQLNSLCFGKEIVRLFVVKGNTVEEQVSQVLAEDSPSPQRDAEIERIRSSEMASAYSRYDQVFKDTATNVVWAVRDRCFIYLMFDPRGSSNRQVYSIAIKELGRRFDGKIPYRELREIDIGYQKQIDLEHRQQYIDFAVESSKTVLHELRRQYDDALLKYRSFYDQAMEWAKLSQKYLDQIEAFDEEGFVRKESEKAQKGYDDTLAIDKVSSVYVKDGIIHVYTHNIYAQDERTKKWHDVGTFHITIGMMSNKYDTQSTVRIMNTKHQVYGMREAMQAPHVFPEGYICHGNLATGMIEAYKRRDLFQLVMQLVLFLQTANTDDAAGKYVNKWPEVPEDVAFAVEEVDVEDVFTQITEAEKKFDDVLAEAIPLHI